MSEKENPEKTQTPPETKKFSMGSSVSGQGNDLGSREKALFLQAMEIEDPQERVRFLKEHCEGNLELLDGVLKLLEACESDSRFIIDRALLVPESTRSGASLRESGTRIRQYTLEKLLGEGGMGEVWLASQTDPVKRKVALKLIRVGRETPGVLQRFEAERQALASMEHPNIATVLDANTSLSGQPFFVMELVNGAPLTNVCDESQLTIEQRLGIFRQIANAISHAHQKAIIHRDLKPSNVLVTFIDGQPVPKVIDFGLAKALTGSLTAESMSTQFGAVVGTLEYMAPEQAGYSGQDIDTRADVYSLGVILYELLTGLRPFESVRFKNATLVEMLRIVKEDEPSIPSARLSSSQSSTKNAALRRIDPGKLSSLLKNELDWIVMKAIDKDRNRRYQSVGEFASDINNFLDGKPVTAHPPSRSYRVKKFVGKNKGLVTSVAMVATALLLGITGTTYGLIKSNANAKLFAIEAKKANDAELVAVKEKAEAVEARNNAIAAAEMEKRQRNFAEAITEFVKYDILAFTTVEGQYRFRKKESTEEYPSVLGKDATLKQLLDRAGKKLLLQDDLDPLAAAELCFVVGVSYRQIGEYSLAVEFLKRCAKTREAQLGLAKEPTLKSLNSLAVAYELDGGLKEAKDTYERALDASKKHLGESAPLTARIMSNLAGFYLGSGNSAEARSLSAQALETATAYLPKGHPDAVHCMVAHANVLRGDREWDEACDLLEQAIEYQKKDWVDGVDLEGLELMNTLGKTYYDARELTKAIKVLLECYERRVDILGERNPMTMTTCSYLIDAYSRTGQFRKAAPLLEKSLELHKDRYGNDHLLTAETTNSLAIACFRNRQYERALELSLDVVEKRKRDFGKDHSSTIAIMKNIGLIRSELGHYEQAIAACVDVLAIVNEKYGDDHIQTLATLHELAAIYSKAKQFDDAIKIEEEVVDKTEAKLGSDNNETLKFKRSLAYTHRLAGNYDQAIPIYESIATVFEKKFGASHPDTISCLNGVANCNLLAENFENAIPVYQRMLKAIDSAEGNSHRHYIMVVSNYAHALVRSKKPENAIPLFRTALDSAQERWGANHPNTIRMHGDLARANYDAGNENESLKHFGDAVRIAKRELGIEHDLTKTLIQHQTDTIRKIEDAKQNVEGSNKVRSPD